MFDQMSTAFWKAAMASGFAWNAESYETCHVDTAAAVTPARSALS
jgi:hypothetical protein